MSVLNAEAAQIGKAGKSCQRVREAGAGGRLLAPESDGEEVESITRQYRFGPLWYGVAIALAFWSAAASLTACLLLALFFAVPPKLATTRRP